MYQTLQDAVIKLHITHMGIRIRITTSNTVKKGFAQSEGRLLHLCKTTCAPNTIVMMCFQAFFTI